MRRRNKIKARSDYIRKSIFLNPKMFGELEKIREEEDTFFVDVVEYLLELGLENYYEGVEHMRKGEDSYLYDE